jgi:hypothetical protein
MSDETKVVPVVPVEPSFPSNPADLEARLTLLKTQGEMDLRQMILDAAGSLLGGGTTLAGVVLKDEATKDAAILVTLADGMVATVEPAYRSVHMSGQSPSMDQLAAIVVALEASPLGKAVTTEVEAEVAKAEVEAGKVVSDAGVAAVKAVEADVPGVAGYLAPENHPNQYNSPPSS